MRIFGATFLPALLFGFTFNLSISKASDLTIDVAKFRQIALKMLSAHFGCDGLLTSEDSFEVNGIYYEEKVIPSSHNKYTDLSRIFLAARPTRSLLAKSWPDNFWYLVPSDLNYSTSDKLEIVQIDSDIVSQTIIIPNAKPINFSFFKSNGFKVSFKNRSDIESAKAIIKILKTTANFMSTSFFWDDLHINLLIYDKNLSKQHSALKLFEDANLVREVKFDQYAPARALKEGTPFRLISDVPFFINLESLRQFTSTSNQPEKIQTSEYSISGMWSDVLVGASKVDNLSKAKDSFAQRIQEIYRKEVLDKVLDISVDQSLQKIIVTVKDEEAIQFLKQKDFRTDHRGYSVALKVVTLNVGPDVSPDISPNISLDVSDDAL